MLKPQGKTGTKRTPTSAFDGAAGKDIYEPEKIIRLVYSYYVIHALREERDFDRTVAVYGPRGARGAAA